MATIFGNLPKRSQGALRNFRLHLQNFSSPQQTSFSSPLSLWDNFSRSSSAWYPISYTGSLITSNQNSSPNYNHDPQYICASIDVPLDQISYYESPTNVTSAVSGHALIRNDTDCCGASTCEKLPLSIRRISSWVSWYLSLVKTQTILILLLASLAACFFFVEAFIYAEQRPVRPTVQKLGDAVSAKWKVLVEASKARVCLSDFADSPHLEGKRHRKTSDAEYPIGTYGETSYGDSKSVPQPLDSQASSQSFFPSSSDLNMYVSSRPSTLTLCSSANPEDGTLVTHLLIPPNFLTKTGQSSKDNSAKMTPRESGRAKTVTEFSVTSRSGFKNLNDLSTLLTERLSSLQFSRDISEYVARRDAVARRLRAEADKITDVDTEYLAGDKAEHREIVDKNEMMGKHDSSSTVVSSRSIVVHMVWAGANSFSAKVIWSLDSLFFRMPNARVRMHVLLPRSSRLHARSVHFSQLYPFWENGYNLQYVEHIDISPYLQKTPLKRVVLSSEDMAGLDPATDLLKQVVSSDILRIVALYNEGGVYIDTDIVVLQDLSPLRNMLACENRDFNNSPGNCVACNAVMAFDKTHPFLQYALEEARKLLETPLDELAQLRWGTMGPRLIMSVLKDKWAHREGAYTYSLDQCEIGHQYLTDQNSLILYSYRSFYPLFWDIKHEDGIARQEYWKSDEDQVNQEILNSLTNSTRFTLHIYGKALSDASRNFLKSLNENHDSIMAKLYQKNCNMFCNTKLLSYWAPETE